MGIINMTPDSFYAPARHADVQAGLVQAQRMITDGVDIIDIGGVRAGQEGAWVDADQELQRVEPMVSALRRAFPEVLISLDTWRASVAERCAEHIDLINDTWASADPELVHVAADHHLGYVVSHTGGLPPRTDPVGIDYGPGDGLMDDVMMTLRQGAERAVHAGVSAGSVLVDPTLDFGKTTLNSLELVARTSDIVALGYPVLMAISRKDFVGETLGLPADDRLEGTLAATAVSAWLGATVFRAHDVLATRRVVDMVGSIRGDRPPTRAERGR